MKNRLESTKEANGHALDPCTKTKRNFAAELKCLLKSAKSSAANVSKYKRILISHMIEARDIYSILFWIESDAFFAFHIWFFFFTFNCKKRGSNVICCRVIQITALTRNMSPSYPTTAAGATFLHANHRANTVLKRANHAVFPSLV